MQTNAKLEVLEQVAARSPDEATNERIRLAPPDNSTVIFRIKVLFLYERLDTTHLLDALRATLRFYPVLAGRMEKDATGRWEAICNNAGARYVRARYSGSLLPGYRNLKAREDILDDGFIPLPHNLYCDEELNQVLEPDSPLLAVQVTEFADGAVAVGFGIPHILVDGHSYFQFLRDWSANAARMLADPSAKLPALKVCHDRSLLYATGEGPKLFHPEYDVQQKSTSSAPIDFSTFQMPPTSVKVFHFSNSDLAKLKAEASKTCVDGEFVSTNDAVSALFLQVITKARAFEDAAPVSLGYAVDGRIRLDNIPDEYFGNATFFGCIDTTAGELAASSLGDCAKLVRHTTNSMTKEYLLDALEWVESQQDASLVIPSFTSFFGNDFTVTNWVKFGIYDINFGQSAPFYAGIPPVQADGFVVLSDAPDGDGIVGTLTMRKDHMDKISEDPLFRAFCQRH
ncbi:hypothetical protein QOT17_020193 [Balamuthia mandrillaris]